MALARVRVNKLKGELLEVYLEECYISDSMKFLRVVSEKGTLFDAQASR